MMTQQFKTFDVVEDAYELLEDLGATTHLIQHVRLVGEAAFYSSIDLRFHSIYTGFDWG
jgi:hypothetical protein